MEIFFNVLVILHLVGFGVVFGASVAQFGGLKQGTARVTPGMLHGSLLQLVTGIALVGMMYALDWGPNNAKIGVKTLVLVIIIALVLMNRKKSAVPAGVLGAIAGLSLLNVCLAVLW